MYIHNRSEDWVRIGSVRYIFLKKLILFFKHGFFKLIKRDSKDIYNVFCFIPVLYSKNKTIYHGFHKNFKQHNYIQHDNKNNVS